MATTVWSKPAARDLAGIESAQARRILDAVDRFALTGHGDIKALRGEGVLRLRVGDYRVRFEIDGGTVRVLRVQNRREAYR